MEREEFDDLLKLLDELIDENEYCNGDFICKYLKSKNIPHEIVRDEQIEYGDDRDEWGYKMERIDEITIIICIDKDYYIEVAWFDPIEDCDNCMIQEVVPYECKYIDYRSLY